MRTCVLAYKTHTDLCSLRSRWSHLYRLLEGRRLRERWPCPNGHMGREDTNLWGNLQGPLGEEKIRTVFRIFMCGCHQPTAITRKTVCLHHLTHDIVYICSMADQSMASTFNLSKHMCLSPLSLSRLYQLQTSLPYYKHITHEHYRVRSVHIACKPWDSETELNTEYTYNNS